MLNLASAIAFSSAVASMSEKFNKVKHNYFIQKFMPGSKELIIGAKAEKGVGHMIMFGMGGVYVEVLKDVVFRVAPLSEDDALDMMDELRGGKLLDDFRGEPAVDRAALARLLVALGEIGLKDPRVAEIDLNPVKLPQGRPLAVDALVVLQD